MDQGVIIIINGHSSSGKSHAASIIHQLKEISPCILMEFDFIISKMSPNFISIEPSDYKEWGIKLISKKTHDIEIIFNSQGSKLYRSFYSSLLNYTSNGINVIVTDVIFNNELYEQVKSCLGNQYVYKIWIETSKVIRQKREEERGDRLSGLYKFGEFGEYKKESDLIMTGESTSDLQKIRLDLRRIKASNNVCR